MTVNLSGWRPTTPANEQGGAKTVTGNRALMLEEPLVFEIGGTEQTGVDFDPPRNGEGDRPAQPDGRGAKRSITTKDEERADARAIPLALPDLG